MRGGQQLAVQDQHEAAGKHVSSDTSSVCLGFWLPGTTSPQIERRPAKSKRLQGCAESHTKIKVTPHASPCKDSLLFLPDGSVLGRESSDKTLGLAAS